MALGQSSPESFSSQVSELAVAPALRPHLEGVYILEKKPLPTFPQIELEASPLMRRKDLDDPHAKYYERQLSFSDGSHAADLIGVAQDPTSEVAIVETPAWWTSMYKGFNAKTRERLHELGRHTFTKGITTNRANSLYRNAWDVHLALNSLDVEEFTTEVIDDEGDSNGAMTGAGVMAYGTEFQRAIRDGYLQDMCIAKKIGLDEVKKAVRHPEYVINEIVCLYKQVKRMAKRGEDPREYIDTIEFSPEFLVGNLLLTRGLFWGELGHLIAHIPEDQQGHFRFFDHSIGNQKKYALRVVRGSSETARQGITTETVTGTHLSIANPHNVDAKVNYFAAQQIRLENLK